MVGTMRRMLLAVVISLAVGACSTPQTDFLRLHPNAVPTRGAVLEPVFFTQRTKECGPAALAMVLTHSGIRVDPNDLVDDVYNPGREGSLTSAVLAAARRHARIAYPIDNLIDLLREVSHRRPVLVLQNLSLQWLPQWHYAVAVGYDLKQGTITLHSGKTEFLKMPLETFEHTWSRGGHWALLTLRPGEFPQRADEKVYVKAVAGVERAGHATTAAEAYKAAVGRWPNSLVALMGLGNALYKLGKHRAAADAFRNASVRHPDSAAAFNNLAHVLAELGKLDEAEQAARTAIALGGPNIGNYRETLLSIMTKRSRNDAGDR